jgi:hypothetical protein
MLYDQLSSPCGWGFISKQGHITGQKSLFFIIFLSLSLHLVTSLIPFIHCDSKVEVWKEKMLKIPVIFYSLFTEGHQWQFFSPVKLELVSCLSYHAQHLKWTCPYFKSGQNPNLFLGKFKRKLFFYFYKKFCFFPFSSPLNLPFIGTF